MKVLECICSWPLSQCLFFLGGGAVARERTAEIYMAGPQSLCSVFQKRLELANSKEEFRKNVTLWQKEKGVFSNMAVALLYHMPTGADLPIQHAIQNRYQNLMIGAGGATLAMSILGLSHLRKRARERAASDAKKFQER